MYQHGTFTFLGLDIEAFHREDRDLSAQMALRSQLLSILDSALKDAGLCSDAKILDRGDGAVVVLSCGPLRVLTGVVPRLTASLDNYNEGKPSRLLLRLRLAVHQGTAAYDERGGYIGRDLTFVFRMIESETMRRQLATTTQPIVLAVSEQVKEEVKAARAEDQQSIPKLGSLSFHTKETRATAWTAQLGRCVPA
ncbi:hypothetical protein GA0070610_0179 [Micromonospora echinofusca]|uniref:Guanylate cyclase domain-containing protein n=1 Tax=Micromonospora echinofusca TaxID=47858 RepID=A0A1C5G2M1_MICEH|nr:hypothetical protein [Micromonospora echinofusca]SCG13987.1 hypothetical protein GA0070610_0179 [Micromonospora echinofusca]